MGKYQHIDTEVKDKWQCDNYNLKKYINNVSFEFIWIRKKYDYI